MTKILMGERLWGPEAVSCGWCQIEHKGPVSGRISRQGPEVWGAEARDWLELGWAWRAGSLHSLETGCRRVGGMKDPLTGAWMDVGGERWKRALTGDWMEGGLSWKHLLTGNARSPERS